MNYIEFVECYEKLASTTKRLEKTDILSEFLKRLEKEDTKYLYLLLGRIVPEYDSRELGISGQLTIKSLSVAYGISDKKLNERLNKIGDLGELAKESSANKKQGSLFKEKLTVDKVIGNLIKVMDVEGKGAVDKKIDLISELLGSASPIEAKYIVRTLMSDLRIGISIPTIIDSFAKTFSLDSDKIQEKYDLANDLAVVFEACKNKDKGLDKIGLVPGKPVNVMLAVKVTNIDEAFEVVGRPAAIEEKYDGFRVLINKDKNGKITLFTRRLENVTNQFPDVVKVIKENIIGESFILDGEIVGYDPVTKKYRPFEAISQRIKRKYEIEKLVSDLPVEIEVFDCLFYNGKSVINNPFIERRKIIEKIVKQKDLVIKIALQIITDDSEKAMEFYEKALKKGEEGIMVKKLDAPYQQGRKVGYMVKMKPEVNDIDLVVIGAEYGTGKRGGLLTSYIVACKSKNELLEVGKVSSGLKEKEEEGFSYEQMTKLLKKLMINESENVIRVKPEIIVSVTYQNIQESPSYSSGYALRFPRITKYRPDRSVKDIVSIDEIKKEVKKGRK